MKSSSGSFIFSNQHGAGAPLVIMIAVLIFLPAVMVATNQNVFSSTAVRESRQRLDDQAANFSAVATAMMGSMHSCTKNFESHGFVGQPLSHFTDEGVGFDPNVTIDEPDRPGVLNPSDGQLSGRKILAEAQHIWSRDPKYHLRIPKGGSKIKECPQCVQPLLSNEQRTVRWVLSFEIPEGSEARDMVGYSKQKEIMILVGLENGVIKNCAPTVATEALLLQDKVCRTLNKNSFGYSLAYERCLPIQ